jgi:hypothetical protein
MLVWKQTGLTELRVPARITMTFDWLYNVYNNRFNIYSRVLLSELSKNKELLFNS